MGVNKLLGIGVDAVPKVSRRVGVHQIVGIAHPDCLDGRGNDCHNEAQHENRQLGMLSKTLTYMVLVHIALAIFIYLYKLGEGYKLYLLPLESGNQRL